MIGKGEDDAFGDIRLGLDLRRLDAKRWRSASAHRCLARKLKSVVLRSNHGTAPHRF